MKTKKTVSLSDLGGPSANIYQMTPKNTNACTACSRLSCIYPENCPNLQTEHKPLIELYNTVSNMPEVKNLVIASGIRYELALQCPDYMRELILKHTGGYLKIAPEHVAPRTLEIMMKPGHRKLEQFLTQFNEISNQANKKQYVIPYFIAAHPGCDDKDMLKVAIWLKKHNIYVDQVQTFLPTPMSAATTIYHTGFNPSQKIDFSKPQLYVPKTPKQRQRQKNIIRYHAPENKNLISTLLKKYKMTHLYQ